MRREWMRNDSRVISHATGYLAGVLHATEVACGIKNYAGQHHCRDENPRESTRMDSHFLVVPNAATPPPGRLSFDWNLETLAMRSMIEPPHHGCAAPTLMAVTSPLTL